MQRTDAVKIVLVTLVAGLWAAGILPMSPPLAKGQNLEPIPERVEEHPTITYPAQAVPLRLKVMSYNIHHGVGTDGNHDLERIARVIKSIDPHLVALQEVDCNTRRTNRVDQTEELARLTNMEAVFGYNIPYQGGEYGNAVLSRLPIVSHKNSPLPTFYEGEQRGLLQVEILLPDRPHPLLVLATHLDYRPNSRERIAAALQINHLITQRGPGPALLIGDINDELHSRTMVELDKEWQPTNTGTVATFPVEEPFKQIDFVLCRPEDAWNVTGTMVLEEKVASDHRPIVAFLELQPPEKPVLQPESSATQP